MSCPWYCDQALLRRDEHDIQFRSLRSLFGIVLRDEGLEALGGHAEIAVGRPAVIGRWDFAFVGIFLDYPFYPLNVAPFLPMDILTRRLFIRIRL